MYYGALLISVKVSVQTLLLQLHISRVVLTYDQRKMETTILHVYFLVLVSVRSRYGPDAWNSLFRELRGNAVASTFKRHLKAELFSRAYGVSLADSSVTVYSQH